MPNALGRPFRLLVLAALVPATASAQTSTKSDQWDSVRDTIQAVMARSHASSVSVAVARHGRIIWEGAFGWANREKMIRATPNTMYSLASISKPMTATGLMTLVEQGKIDLDRPANEYLGVGKIIGLAGDADGATVRRVMSHTAGLPLYYQFYYVDRPYPVLSNDEVIGRYGILVNPPGSVYEYSNLGYGIIDEIMSRASNTDYADFMRLHVFIPLGLTHTSVGVGPGLEPYIAERYDAKQRPIPFYDTDHHGASAIYSSAHDLIRFGMFHLKDHLADQQRILKDETIDSMHRPVAPAHYGLGWILEEGNGLRTVSHTGGMPGVATALTLYPDEDAAIVVLINRSGGTGSVTGAIERLILPRYAEARRSAITAMRQAAAAARKPFVAPSELLGEWTGTVRTWESTIPITLVFQPDGDVHVRLDKQPEEILHDVRWDDNNLIGTFAGTIPTSDAERWPHDVQLSLRLRNGTLSGMASAISTTERVYWALTSYATLTRKPSIN